MGCNSHLTIEVKGRWEHSPERWDLFALDIPESRHYRLYEAMAGVRGEEDNAVVQPRGIPADADRGTLYWIKRADSDGHSHSWLYAKEFIKALEQATDDKYGNGKEWDSLVKVLAALETVYGENNVRLVFFFDN
ncbi:MAG: hypothetical protein ACREBR_05435 [bacterium]